MPTLEIIQTFRPAPAVLFARLRRPAEIVALAPPEFGLTLGEAPELLSVGDTYTVVARRWGLRQTIVTGLVECVENERLVEEQRRGPMRRWRLERLFRPHDGGTELTERIDFEPPTGLLGLTLTEHRIADEIRAGYEWRRERLDRVE